ncbi:helix-turn-helix domain-containing protein [Candidatus Poribacteria bacterium]|nr:helix-turn-helix domain-containing protein [Candidatus Poribacteria bacterium]
MSKKLVKLTIKQAIERLKLSDSTIRRRIENGELQAEKIGNQWFIIEEDDQETIQGEEGIRQNDKVTLQNEEEVSQNDKVTLQSVLIPQLQSEISYLREQLDHHTQLLGLAQKNIGALTEQLDDSRQMIEDMRSRSWWKRIFRR